MPCWLTCVLRSFAWPVSWAFFSVCWTPPPGEAVRCVCTGKGGREGGRGEGREGGREGQIKERDGKTNEEMNKRERDREGKRKV